MYTQLPESDLTYFTWNRLLVGVILNLVRYNNLLPAPAPVVTLERYTPTTSLDGLSEFSIENFILPTL